MENPPASFYGLVDIVAKLRSPGGCPWDREQTHESLKRNLLEESYEALEAIDSGSPDKIAEEMGDILVQTVFHAQMASEAGAFTIDDVVAGISDKLVRRHPHVFGDVQAADAREVELNWDALKEQETKGKRKSPVEGIPKDMPALAYAQLMQDRVGRAGFEWDDISGALDKLAEEIGELQNTKNDKERAEEYGDVLFMVVSLARWLGLQAEDSLRQSNLKFQKRYTAMEEMAVERGLDFSALPLSEKQVPLARVQGASGVGLRRANQLCHTVVKDGGGQQHGKPHEWRARANSAIAPS